MLARRQLELLEQRDMHFQRARDTMDNMNAPAAAAADGGNTRRADDQAGSSDEEVHNHSLLIHT